MEALEPASGAAGNGKHGAPVPATARAFVQARVHETGRQVADGAAVGSFDSVATLQFEAVWAPGDNAGWRLARARSLPPLLS